jgi:single-strand DNA-binding protein
MGINKVILVGNLGRKPEIRYTSNGTPVANFTLATTERWGTDEQGQRKEHTEWHRCVAWRKLAEICNQYLDKGTKVYVEGKIRRSDFTGQDGVKRYSTEIVIDQMEILTPKGMRESVPAEPSYSDFPGASGEPVGAGQQTRKGSSGGGSVPAPPDDVDLDPDMDLEEDENFFTD